MSLSSMTFCWLRQILYGLIGPCFIVFYFKWRLCLVFVLGFFMMMIGVICLKFKHAFMLVGFVIEVLWIFYFSGRVFPSLFCWHNHLQMLEKNLKIDNEKILNFFYLNNYVENNDCCSTFPEKKNIKNIYMSII